MEAVVERAGKDLLVVVPDLVSKVRKVAVRILGCWHLSMSRPFSRGNETYRTCVACGARRRFDLEQWEMVGSFYYPEGKVGLCQDALSRACVGMQRADSVKLWREQHVIANSQK